MKILITGAAGFLGCRLTKTILQLGQLRGEKITKLVLFDLHLSESLRLLLEDFSINTEHIDVSFLKDDLQAVFTSSIDSNESRNCHGFNFIFHLASAVSAECEKNFELGVKSLELTQNLLEVHAVLFFSLIMIDNILHNNDLMILPENKEK